MVGSRPDFIDVFADALRRRLGERKKQKGDSWLTCDLDFLYEKLKEEHKEVQELRLPDFRELGRSPRIEHPSDDFKYELTDLGLVAAMLYWRESGQTTPYVPPPR